MGQGYFPMLSFQGQDFTLYSNMGFQEKDWYKRRLG